MILLFAAKDGESLYSQQKQDQELTGSDHERPIAKVRLTLKKVRRTTRAFRYALNQIPFNYTVEVRNRFKGLDLIQYLMHYGWRFVTLYRRQGARSSARKINEKNLKKRKKERNTWSNRQVWPWNKNWKQGKG